MSDAAERRAQLLEVYREASTCTRCPLSETRTKVVFGAGEADADLMFVGEAPGAEEDRQGLPFVGRAGQLLTQLLAGIGLSREDVFIMPLLHPAAALRTPSLVETLEGDFRSLAELLEQTPPRSTAPDAVAAEPEPNQLGLFG